MSCGFPNNWIETSLDEVVEVWDNLREPVNAKARAGRHGSYPYYGATGQVGWIDGFRQDGEYVLLGEDGAPFLDPVKPKAYLVDGKCWVNNHAHVLRGRDGICHNRYLMHALNVTDYRGFANGTTRLKLTQEAMRRLPIKVAPANEQERIVSKIEELLSDLDAGVAALERARANLKRYRAAVLKAAVEGRLTEQWRKEHSDVEPASKLLERILAERRRKWEEAQLAKCATAGKTPPKGWKNKYPEPARPDTTALRELPEGWCWTCLGQLKSWAMYGPRFSSDGYVNDGCLVLRTTDFSDSGTINLQTPPKLALTPEDFQKYKVEAGNLLITRTGSLGTLAVFQGGADAIAGAFLIHYRLTVPITTVWYVFHFLKSPVGNRALVAGGAGIGRPNLNMPTIDAIPIPLPPLPEQEHLISEIEERLTLANAVDATFDINRSRASRLRQSILKRAFEGKLVPQDPSDEPASVLLERIRAARADQSGAPGTVSPRRGRRKKAS